MEASSMLIRSASENDAAAILDIYRGFIRNTVVTFEEEVPTLEQFRARMQSISCEYPFLVCEDGGRIAGYAYAHRHQSRESYRYGAELSVYLRPHYTGLGVGRAICDAIADILKLQGVQTLYSAVSLPNDASCALHRSMGFEEAGLWRNSGYKKGRWVDVQWYQLAIGDYPERPGKLYPVGEVNPTAIAAILKRASERIAVVSEE